MTEINIVVLFILHISFNFRFWMGFCPPSYPQFEYDFCLTKGTNECLFNFQLIIFCDAVQYKVAVNGVHTLEYKHRFKQLGKIDILEIGGDIRLLDVRSW